MRVPQTVAAIGLATAALTSATAGAQPAPSVAARSWRPSTDADASVVLEPAVTAGPGRWNLGAWAQYEQGPGSFGGSAGSTPRPMQRGVGLDVLAGLGVGTSVAVGVDVPVFVWQNSEAASLPTSGLGDVAVLGKATLISNDRLGVHTGFGLAALGNVSLPTGARSNFLSDGALTAQLQMLAEYAVGIGALRAEAGYSLRGSHVTWKDPTSGAVTLGNAIPWAVGLVVRPKVFSETLDNGDRQLWEIAAHGSLPGGPVAPFGWSGSGASLLSPALLAIDDRVALGHYRETFVLVGADIGLGSAIGVPTVRAMLALTWAPKSHDIDDDGIADDRDQCPDLPEDRDGIQDADGCPEDDADGDEIIDRDDACPLVPGVASSDPKRNGCPGPAPAPESAPAAAPEDKAP